MVCGANLVFSLNDGEHYARRLTTEDIDDLDFKVVWNGPRQTVNFEANDEKAVECLNKIITNINLMQPEVEPEENFYGFPLASIKAHLRAFLYEEIRELQDCFYTTIFVSGEETGTGLYISRVDKGAGRMKLDSDPSRFGLKMNTNVYFSTQHPPNTHPPHTTTIFFKLITI